jgi:myo-inositol-1(or 4)-monophosphatase
MVSPEVKDLCDLLRRVGDEELLPRFGHIGARLKCDGTLVTEADLAAQGRIAAELARRYPSIPLLGEEMSPADQTRALSDARAGIWCLDPLDGTSNYAAGIPVFGISLALIREGRAEIGLVYDPVRSECFRARVGEGAWLDGRRLSLPAGPKSLAECIAIVDFKRLEPAIAAGLAIHPPFRSQRSFGSVALDWCWLAAGRGHLYLHGGQKLWDYAAGRLIFSEAGGAGGCSAGIDVAVAEELSLSPRLAMAATDARLLDEWRRTLLAFGDAS